MCHLLLMVSLTCWETVEMVSGKLILVIVAIISTGLVYQFDKPILILSYCSRYFSQIVFLSL